MKKINVAYCLIYNVENQHVLMVNNIDSNSWSLPGGKVLIQNPHEISEVPWVHYSMADKLMPYHKCGISKLLSNSASYCFQDA